MTVFPGMIEVVMLIPSMANPSVRARVNVRCGRMSAAVTVIRVLILRWTLLLARRRSRSRS